MDTLLASHVPEGPDTPADQGFELLWTSLGVRGPVSLSSSLPSPPSIHSWGLHGFFIWEAEFFQRRKASPDQDLIRIPDTAQQPWPPQQLWSGSLGWWSQCQSENRPQHTLLWLRALICSEGRKEAGKASQHNQGLPWPQSANSDHLALGWTRESALPFGGA